MDTENLMNNSLLAKMGLASQLFLEMSEELRRSPTRYDPVANLGGMIKCERKRQGITQSELAQMTGLSTPTVVRIEKGDTKASFENVEQILRVLGKSLWVR